MPVRIYDIAKRLGVDSKVVLAKAKELGYDAGFGTGCYAENVASFAIEEWVRRQRAIPNRSRT